MHESERDGDLRLELAATVGARSDIYEPLLTNTGNEALHGEQLTLVLRWCGLPFRNALPILHEEPLEPGESRGERYTWQGSYRSSRGSLLAEMRDSSGRARHARVDFEPPPNLPLAVCVRRGLRVARIFEALAAAFAIWSLLPGWIISPIAPGLCLFAAGSVRLPYVAAYARRPVATHEIGSAEWIATSPSSAPGPPARPPRTASRARTRASY